MNSAHDLGGMEGFGPINPEPEDKEPVFHVEWEGRVYGINRALGSLGLWNIDMGRHARERQHPADYLRHTYYENWLAGLQRLLVESGLVSEAELKSGRADGAAPEHLKAKVLKPEKVVNRVLTNYVREVDAPPRFQPGDRVRTVNRHPHGHTREPRYLRGRVGTVLEHYGAQVYPDLSAQGVDEGRHLYCVRFEASELWGESAEPRAAVYADLWEPYLEPAE
jgi:nitrile hydratase